ncbi:MAG: Uncharacterised protein [Opitutia bacterium UBA7350]|nr:MAG: Uncharacterised protein [Opitutae bacterium UBA7350]
MYKKINFFLLSTCLITSIACSEYSTIPAGAEVELANPVTPLFKGPTIVHADMIERIATIRYGHELEEVYLIVKDTNGEQVALLKSLPLRPGSLRTADILEGTPKINQRVSSATTEQNEAYQKIYPNVTEDN